MITIDWGELIIHVQKVDMTLVQSTPTEVRELDLNQFHLTLKTLEATDEGMSYPATHTNNAPVNVGGVLLARVLELINEYTVTFEDGIYAVNLVGANSNVGDNVNLNSVSIRSTNSAGLVQVNTGGSGLSSEEHNYLMSLPVDVLSNKCYELTSGNVPVIPTMKEAVMLLYMMAVNAVVSTPSSVTLHNNAGDVLAQAPVSVDGSSSVTRGNLA